MAACLAAVLLICWVCCRLAACLVRACLTRCAALLREIAVQREMEEGLSSAATAEARRLLLSVPPRQGSERALSGAVGQKGDPHSAVAPAISPLSGLMGKLAQAQDAEVQAWMEQDEGAPSPESKQQRQKAKKARQKAAKRAAAAPPESGADQMMAQGDDG